MGENGLSVENDDTDDTDDTRYSYSINNNLGCKLCKELGYWTANKEISSSEFII